MRIFQRSSLAGWLVCVLLIVISIFSRISPAQAQTPTPGKLVYIYLFWGDGCPHCAKARVFIENLKIRYPGVIIRDFEVYYNSDNQRLFLSMMQKYGVEQSYVPTIFIGHFFLQGYSEEADPEIEKAVDYCLQNGCTDPGEGIPGFSAASTIIMKTSPQSSETESPFLTATPTHFPGKTTKEPVDVPQAVGQDHILEIPVIGRVDLDLQSTTLSTVLIAFVDGFNPCSMWVLSMLMALTLHTGSRKKVLLIGLVFLSVTAIIYALFMAGLFSALKIASFLGWIQVLVALVALFFGLVNIKDYFWYKEGISFTIAEGKKSGVFKQMRAVIVAGQSFWGLVGATIVLAAGVSLVEFSCTAGFPVLWVNLLNAQNISGMAFLYLLLLYMLVYQLDISAVFLSAVVSLRASRLEEKHGRILKLAGGMLMIALSILMLVDPSLLNNLRSSLLVFGAAFLATLLVLFIHRILLPKFGIHIGTEPVKKQKHH